MSEEEDRRKEGQRQCLACRNWVSVLATKCHYCGETLGRHKREEETKTIEDLGGVSANQYTVSGNVMDALESFRAENLSAQEEQRRQREEMSQSWFGKKDQFDSQGRPTDEMPDLDEHHQSLREAVTSSHEPSLGSRRKKKSQNPISPDHIRYAAIAVGIALVLGLGYQFGLPAYRSYVEARNEPPPVTYENRALKMLQSGAPAIEALEEAHEALKYARNEENVAILEEVRVAFIEEMRALLEAREFRQSNLDRASELIGRATRVDRSPELVQLQDEITEEVAAHKFVLVGVDADAKQATFNLNNAYIDEKEQTVGVGDRLQERFIVTAITSNSVRLEDTVRTPNGRQRPLVSRPFRAVDGR